MPDVMLKPDDEAAMAAETKVVQRCYYYFPESKKAVAREQLRAIAKGELFKTEDGMADVALELLWNILAGN
jgi:hypothetical protein